MMEPQQINEEPTRETEQAFLAGLEWEEYTDSPADHYASWQRGEYDHITVERHVGEPIRYIINNDGDAESYEEYINTTSYRKFMDALDEINAMSYDQYCANFL